MPEGSIDGEAMLRLYLDASLWGSCDEKKSHRSGCLDSSFREFHADVVSEIGVLCDTHPVARLCSINMILRLLFLRLKKSYIMLKAHFFQGGEVSKMNRWLVMKTHVNRKWFNSLELLAIHWESRDMMRTEWPFITPPSCIHHSLFTAKRKWIYRLRKVASRVEVTNNNCQIWKW